jgi:hypothetical protein
MSLTTAAPLENPTPHGLPMSHIDRPTSGFTAVNGDHQRTTSFRPDNNAGEANPPSAPEHERKLIAIENGNDYHSHGWHPHEEVLPPPQDPNATRKRKRSSSTGYLHCGDNVPSSMTYTNGSSSPKAPVNQKGSVLPLDSPEKATPPFTTSADRGRSPMSFSGVIYQR